MKGHGEKLSRNQERAIAALLVHPTMLAAAAAAGVGEVTLWRWLQIPEFKEQYRLARREAVSQAVGHLQGACSVAVVALTDISQDVNCPASARVSAARTVLELALKGVELEDLAVRVEELELQVTRA
jgi:hypothetical protein